MTVSRRLAVRLVALAAALVTLPVAACTSVVTPPPAAAAAACDDLGLLPCPRLVAYAALPIAGSAFRLTYASDRAPGRTADPAPPAAPVGLGGWTLDVLDSLDPATRTLVSGTGRPRAVTPVPLGDGRFAVAAVDGATVDVFDADGRVLAVYDGVTGASRLTFTWDAHGLAS
ncbi:hypothetical protein BJF78_08050 [Pseudonocardia sp. CNS-139]|nr:hypothetical protein BJF78_08050 [Pseudonocardia sp. CNS-139]